ncbi:ABC transporter ATP-binding protein [Inmirania thermothiophila]|uniref:Iron(III) transport system ATP-binding protein n=1 Tax=Inmirania thermothiophila TaxID=1750597 RepID=A0A3N1Y8C1_9GAMM|nr:ABC transporter ATP-binding protein [Inmirania thermothiophila]ROR35025.1 iron(III) transport system ATP-binding protein [Inmirania thermothiophila]
MTQTPPLLEVRGIRCAYGRNAVVHDLSLHLPRGVIAGLVGPSGCGKTTVLRAIAGLQPLVAGEILLEGRVLSGPGAAVPPERRGIGMVFQEHTLFPHLSIGDNVAFGLRGRPAAERRRTVERMLALVGLEGLAGRYPHELSGGQQQRVALARALAPGPRLLLLDEPFSSLDVELRQRLALEVREILVREGITAILVTHDQGEAFAICERVGVMHAGRILQWDTPYNLYHDPADRFVADFIGEGVFVAGRLVDPETLETEAGVLRGDRAYPWPPGTAVDVLVRPDDVVPDPDGPLAAIVRNKAFRGAETLYTLELPTGARVLSLFPSHLDHGIGERVRVRVAADHLVAFPREEEAAA